MNLQFISDSSGKTTGVFIPIKEWNELKNRFKGIAQAELDIPLWQTEEVDNRMEAYKNNPEQALDFEDTMNEIEKEL